MHSIAIGKMPVIKLLLVMKMTAFLMLFCLLQVAARTSAQVTLQEKSASLEKVLAKIKQQSGYGFVFDDALIRAKGKPVYVDVNNVPVEKALEEVFKGQDQLGYSLNGKIISVKEKTEKKSAGLAGGINTGLEIPALPPIVSGRITDEKGKPVAGVTISVKGGKVIGITNDNGEFILENVPADATLVFAAVNIENHQVKVNGRTDLSFVAREKVSNLEEIIVNKGYYSTTQKLNTGNVSKVTAETIGKQPVTNPLAALEGTVPGLFITQSNGLPASNFNVLIRGQNSISSGNQPLYIIDGVPFAINTLTQVFGANGLQSPLNSINPSDIESIEVLKDADATAIYGSRGANGIILITTKKGKTGKAKFSVNVYDGHGKVTRATEMMNTQQYVSMRREAFANDGLSVNSPDLLIWDTTRYTDWRKLLIGNTAHISDAQVSLSGGSAGTLFRISGGMHKEGTVFPGDIGDTRASLQVNISHKSDNQKLVTSFSAFMSHDRNNLTSTDLTSGITKAPNAPSYDAMGNLVWYDNGSNIANPLSPTLSSFLGVTDNLIGNLNVSYQLLPGLFIKTNAGYTNTQLNETNIFPKTFYNPALNRASGNTNFGYNKFTSWIIEPQLEYSRTLFNGRFNAIFGGSWQAEETGGSVINASNYSNEALLNSTTGAGTISTSTSYSLYRYQAFFARLNYETQKKYVVNLTARRDGSSRFGPGKQFSNFGAIGGAWIFTQEDFLKNSSLLSFGKLRGSYGITGNDKIGDYQFLDLYSGTTYPYQGVGGLVPSRLFNSDFAWETSRKLEFATDLSFMQDHLMLSVSWFRNISGNQLLNYTLPVQTGFSGITQNLPATVENKGWEFELTARNFLHGAFKWNSSFNLTIAKNKLLDYPGLSTSSNANRYSIGSPLNIFKVFKYVDVNPQTGLYEFLNRAGQLTSTPSAPNDNTIIKDLNPAFYGGFTNSFQYKGFDLSIFLQFVKQTGRNYLYSSPAPPGFNGYNQPLTLLARWQKPGDLSEIQRFTTGGAGATAFVNFKASDGVYTDASYIRAKNISLSYSLPEKLLNKWKIQSLKLYVQGQNLFTITKYKGGDPEIQNTFTGLPPLKIITAGIQLSL
jgi:TonB-linked SusC/RagA family outer membrane protein